MTSPSPTPTSLTVSAEKLGIVPIQMQVVFEFQMQQARVSCTVKCVGKDVYSKEKASRVACAPVILPISDEAPDASPNVATPLVCHDKSSHPSSEREKHCKPRSNA